MLFELLTVRKLGQICQPVNTSRNIDYAQAVKNVLWGASLKDSLCCCCMVGHLLVIMLFRT